MHAIIEVVSRLALRGSAESLDLVAPVTLKRTATSAYDVI